MLFANDVVLVDMVGKVSTKLEMWRNTLEASSFKLSRERQTI